MDKIQAERIYDSGKEPTVAMLLQQDHRIQHLEQALARHLKNSSNSSKPPSSDIVKPPRPSPNGSGKRRIGAQEGHARHEHPLLDESRVDAFLDYHLQRCPHCNGAHLLLLDKNDDYAVRRFQQHDLPQKPIYTTEHRCHASQCADCGTIAYATLPSHVSAQGMFGPGLCAAMGLLKFDGALSFSALQRYCSDILMLPAISSGFLAKTIQRISDSLETTWHDMLLRLPDCPVVNVDETSHKENGKLHWTWVFKSELFTFFKIDPSRGSEVLIDVLGKEFAGALGCDYFSAYRKFMGDFNIVLQFCLAHLIREVKFLLSLPDNATKLYGQRLLDAIKQLFHVIHMRDQLGPRQFQSAIQRARKRILRVARTAVPLTKEAMNIAKRFKRHGKAYFQFITTPGLDPTNNTAERALRFIVKYRHISQGTRSINGRNACERIWSVLATCRQQGKSFFDFLRQALTAHMNGTAPPVLIT